MATRFSGERIKRDEDPRLLTGKTMHGDDVMLTNIAQAALVRSPRAHARIKRVGSTMAVEQEGVIVICSAPYLPPNSFPIQ